MHFEEHKHEGETKNPPHRPRGGGTSGQRRSHCGGTWWRVQRGGTRGRSLDARSRHTEHGAVPQLDPTWGGGQGPTPPPQSVKRARGVLRLWTTLAPHPLSSINPEVSMATPHEELQRIGLAGRFRLARSAISLHPSGPALHDDLWMPDMQGSSIVGMRDLTTQHALALQPSDVLSVEPDPDASRDGLTYLRVRLARQPWLCGANAGWVAPPARRRRRRRRA